MKNLSLITLSLTAILGLSACGIKTAADVNKDIEKQLAEDKKKNEDLVNSVKVSFEQGGQPGVIKVAGVMVKEDSKTDARITVVSKGGIGKDGTEAPVGAKNKPTFNSKADDMKLESFNEKKNLIALGCDEQLTADFAAKRSLEVEPVPAPVTKDLMSISAKTIVLCGKMGDIRYSYIDFSADELILDQVDFTQTAISGWINFNTNKLVLLGANQLMVRGIPLSLTVSLAPSIEFNVLKEISSNEDGKLLLSAIGSNYEEEKK